ncbi:hypothetical protein GCM10011331_03280 [Flavimobilis marinus]|uniref:Uncharacterized protein n=1 Tax=Flavimobilis marinus TaxID=285351 RepID=A0A1I2DR44_9MICO|nr:hypothetical protein [Flavimobilis marinus]GHG44593.1 hypothetical protein GCM10011331_03280 [Flavimobilis marinus]SFE82773.1 hypothetical protein SAMN04488035_0673 [Flavimobilis marinus]
MSTVPGDDAARDAGLLDQEPSSLIEAVEAVEADRATAGSPLGSRDAEEYQPAPARPDLAGEADEADVAEQAAVVPLPPAGALDDDAAGEIEDEELDAPE